MRRRKFITLLGGSAAAWPLVARAQRRERIGVLLGGSATDGQTAPSIAAFERALGELGWTVGRNITIDYHFAAGETERMRMLARQLVESKPALIVGHTTPVVAALQNETRAIPIVFVVVSDPIGSGFVASLPRPGGNITGFVNLEGSLGGKWIELLRETVPVIARAALMFNPDTAPHWDYYLRPFETAARSLDIEPVPARVGSATEIEQFMSSFAEAQNGGLVVMPDIFIFRRDHLDLIMSVAGRRRLPVIYPYRYATEAGGLMSYGFDNFDLWRRAPTYIDRILKGANPAELPVQLPTKFELAINLKTANTLGLTFPPMLLARADAVIE
jgi:putative ABC transport system substrate-binding protein